jgi:hypothetical protein
MHVEYAAAHTVHTNHWQILVLLTATLRHDVEHQLIFYGANVRNTCSTSDCDTLWKILVAEIICKYHCDVQNH